MNVLMVTSETVPFSKSGGLADVVGALSSALSSRGHSVKVFMPLYGFIPTKGFKDGPELEVEVLGGAEKCPTVEQEVAGVTYVALAHQMFTKRNGIYGDTSFEPYSDNALRYFILCKAAVAYAEKVWTPDVLHCHDWTAGPACAFAKAAKLPARVVFTIHNLAYQGEFARLDALFGAFRPSSKMLSGNGLEKRFNFLKTGLEYADKITTVSPTYAREIQEREQGCGLDWLLRERKADLCGVINGIDLDEWSPETDRYLPANYSADDLSGKAEVKAFVQEKFGLPAEPGKPLVSMISRLAEQKGFGPLLEGRPCALERLLDRGDCQFLVIGTGDKRYEDRLREIASTRKNISVNIVFSQELSHLAEAGADFFLMPSKYEPCGLNQMYSLRYGTLPIAHRTGGLADTITDMAEQGGDGFLFDNVYSDEIVQAVGRAFNHYHDTERFNAARSRAMRKDFSWDKSANEYEKIYSNQEVSEK